MGSERNRGFCFSAYADLEPADASHSPSMCLSDDSILTRQMLDTASFGRFGRFGYSASFTTAPPHNHIGPISYFSCKKQEDLQSASAIDLLNLSQS